MKAARAVAILLMFCSGVTIAAELNVQPSLSASATLVADTTATVSYTVTNNTNTTLSISIASLPWNQPNGITTIMRINGDTLRSKA